MKKRLQIIFEDKSWEILESIMVEANKDFEVGRINYSDVINEMILKAQIDIHVLRQKNTSLKRSLKVLASKNLDIDSVIESLLQLKGKTRLKKSKPMQMEGGV